MSEQAGVPVSAALPTTPGGGRKVVGKPLLAVSSAGMAIVVAMLCRGNWLEAGTAFLLTVAALEMMLQRALAQFDATTAKPAGQQPLQRAARPTP
jgi:hypothetical protein